MKKFLSVFVAALLISLICIPAFAAEDVITINPSAKEAAVGDEITVSFDIKDGLTGVNAVVKYDSAYLEYVKDSATATDLMTTELNDGTAGEIKVASVSTEPSAAGALFTAKFKVKKVNAVISVEPQSILDASDNDIAADANKPSVTIAEKVTEATTNGSDENATTPDGGNGGNGGNGGGNGGNNSNGGGNTNNNPKTGNTPVVGAAAAVLVASAAVIVAMKKKNED